MIVAAISNVTEQVRFAGIQPVTESGNPAKIDLQDQALVVNTIEGDATGTIENYNEATGSFDVVLKPGTAGTASLLRLVADADNDAGDVREITLDFNYTVRAEEAFGFTMPEPVIEPLA